LQNEIDPGMGNSGADASGLVADDREDIVRRDDPSGRCDDMSEKRLAANFMQDLGKLRFEPRAFACRHNGDSDAGSRRHGSF